MAIMMKKHKALFFSLLGYCILTTGLLLVSLSLTNGHFVYALDDAYIHMAIAKNLVNKGLWTTNYLNFTSSSSSPLWVLLIFSGYLIFGVNIFVPFVLNFLFQVLSIIAFYVILRYFNVLKFQWVFLFGFIITTPLPAVLFGGMEHSVQIFLTLLFLFFSAKLIASKSTDPRVLKCLIFITPLMAAVRYEDVILGGIVSLLLVLRKKFVYSILILALCILPVLIYGFVSTSQGCYFVPNTLLLKSTPTSFSFIAIVRFCYKIFTNITLPHVFVLLISCFLLFVNNWRIGNNLWSEKLIFILIAFVTTLIDMSLIQYQHNGAFYRYDAYLVALCFTSIVINVGELLRKNSSMLLPNIKSLAAKGVMLLLALVALSPLVVRSITAFGVPIAEKEYFEQHYQMSQFVMKLPRDMGVAANDIGMLSYYYNGNIVDLWGLSNIKVAREKLSNRYNTDFISDITRREKVRVAILYEHWFDECGGLPQTWKKIGEWKVTDSIFFIGTETLSFYVTNGSDEDSIRAILNEFSHHLPQSVTYRIFY